MRLWFGQVTSASPLMVAPTGSSTGIQMGGALVAGLVVGDRVAVLATGNAHLCIGKNIEY